MKVAVFPIQSNCTTHTGPPCLGKITPVRRGAQLWQRSRSFVCDAHRPPCEWVQDSFVNVNGMENYTVWPKVSRQASILNLGTSDKNVTRVKLIHLLLSLLQILLGRLSTEFWYVATGIDFHSSWRIFKRLETNFGHWGLAHNVLTHPNDMIKIEAQRQVNPVLQFPCPKTSPV